MGSEFINHKIPLRNLSKGLADFKAESGREDVNSALDQGIVAEFVAATEAEGPIRDPKKNGAGLLRPPANVEPFTLSSVLLKQ